jgi:hypothetical protein
MFSYKKIISYFEIGRIFDVDEGLVLIRYRDIWTKSRKVTKLP